MSMRQYAEHCCTLRLTVGLPSSWADLSQQLCDGDTERDEAVKHCTTDLELCDQTVEVLRHEALIPQVHSMHLGLGAVRSVVSAPALPKRRPQMFRRPKDLVARDDLQTARGTNWAHVTPPAPVSNALSCPAPCRQRQAGQSRRQPWQRNPQTGGKAILTRAHGFGVGLAGKLCRGGQGPNGGRRHLRRVTAGANL